MKTVKLIFFLILVLLCASLATAINEKCYYGHEWGGTGILGSPSYSGSYAVPGSYCWSQDRLYYHEAWGGAGGLGSEVWYQARYNEKTGKLETFGAKISEDGAPNDDKHAYGQKRKEYNAARKTYRTNVYNTAEYKKHQIAPIDDWSKITGGEKGYVYLKVGDTLYAKKESDGKVSIQSFDISGGKLSVVWKEVPKAEGIKIKGTKQISTEMKENVKQLRSTKGLPDGAKGYKEHEHQFIVDSTSKNVWNEEGDIIPFLQFKDKKVVPAEGRVWVNGDASSILTQPLPFGKEGETIISGRSGSKYHIYKETGDGTIYILKKQIGEDGVTKDSDWRKLSGTTRAGLQGSLKKGTVAVHGSRINVKGREKAAAAKLRSQEGRDTKLAGAYEKYEAVYNKNKKKLNKCKQECVDSDGEAWYQLRRNGALCKTSKGCGTNMYISCDEGICHVAKISRDGEGKIIRDCGDKCYIFRKEDGKRCAKADCSDLPKTTTELFPGKQDKTCRAA